MVDMICKMRLFLIFKQCVQIMLRYKLSSKIPKCPKLSHFKFTDTLIENRAIESTTHSILTTLKYAFLFMYWWLTFIFFGFGVVNGLDLDSNRSPNQLKMNCFWMFHEFHLTLRETETHSQDDKRVEIICFQNRYAIRID